MRAFTITAAGVGEVRDVPRPDPGPGEAIVKVAYVGVCGTDYRIYHGEFNSRFPLVNGHEFSGVVSDVGADVVDWHPGDRVAVDPTLYCGHCYHCLRRQSNHCDLWGAIGDTRDGALAEFVRVPARNLYRVDDSVRLDEAALTEPLACVVWGVERLRLMPASHALIFGAGPIGSLLTALLSASGTADVTVVDVVDSKLEIARRFGASATFTTGPDLDAILRERRQGRGYDAVIDCTGVPSVIEGLFRHAGPNARIMFFGVAPPAAKIPISPFDVYHQDWEILGSMAINYTFQQAHDLLSSRRIDVQSLITSVVDLDEVGDILRRPKEAGELKTLVAPNGV
jgi:2-desacetyl-2-hydroxyethyl bacteriochlorophyllide A dehydrogenase